MPPLRPSSLRSPLQASSTHRLPTRHIPPPHLFQSLFSRTVATASVAAPEHVDTPIQTPSYPPPQPEPKPAPPNDSSQRLTPLPPGPPLSSFLRDTHARQHTYLRISLTERCNLRCTYCMPAAGVPLSPPTTQLSTPEILLLARLFVSCGVDKIRLTGGEPTVRRDFMGVVGGLGELKDTGEGNGGLKELCITSNGLALGNKLEGLLSAGLTGINLSLDTLSPSLFEKITRRRGFERVWSTIEKILALNTHGAGIKLKINVVIMRGLNDTEIPTFVSLTQHRDLEVRFIEYMPFSGNRWARSQMVGYAEMLSRIRAAHPGLRRLGEGKSEVGKVWGVEGWKGRVGFVTSMTENFCAGCNRLRVTGDGSLKVCLFGNAEVSLRDLLRRGNGGEVLDWGAWGRLRAGGREGEGGVLRDRAAERELLEVIGGAVGRKKARHAGMGELENMKNRPMILIDNHRQLFHPIFNNPISKPAHRIPLHLLSPSSPFIQRRLFSTTLSRPKDSNPFPPPPTPSSSSTSSPSSSSPSSSSPPTPSPPSLPHLTPRSEIHVIPISNKTPSHRVALATGTITFSNANPLPLIRSNALKKGDVLAVARVAGVMAAKKTPDIVPLCHSGVGVEGVGVWVECVEGLREGDTQGEERASERASGRRGGMEAEAEAEGADGDERSPALRRFLGEGIGEFGGIRLAAEVSCTGKTGVEMEALCAVAGAGLSVLDMVKGVDKGCVMDGVRVVRKEGGRSGVWRAEGW